MSKLVWDKTGERFFETGIDQCVLFPMTSTGEYGKGVAWNGVTSISENPSGADANAIWADNIKYLNLISNEEFAASLNAYTYPDEFEACDGSAEIAEGIVIGQQARLGFGLCYRTKIGNDVEGNDHGYKLHFIYGCKASPSDRSYETINDSPDAAELSWEINTTPVNVEGHKPTATLVVNSKKVDAEILKQIEDMVYGTESSEPKLPLPSEILALVGA